MKFLQDGPQDGPLRVVLAHGAGAPMDSETMNAFATALAGHDIGVVRFEFSYMERRRRDGRRRPPDRLDTLMETWLAVVETLAPTQLVIGGKSMGGRIATMIADRCGARGVICVGYPFHPSGRPEKLRVEHLRRIQTPTLILQGERDPFGRPDEVAGYALSQAISVEWLPDGDHDLKPRRASGRTHAENQTIAADRAAAFVDGLVTPG